MESLSVRFHIWNISFRTLTLCDTTRKNVDDCWPKERYKVALFPPTPMYSLMWSSFLTLLAFYPGHFEGKIDVHNV